jgi:hypothetical protein
MRWEDEHEWWMRFLSFVSHREWFADFLPLFLLTHSVALLEIFVVTQANNAPVFMESIHCRV